MKGKAFRIRKNKAILFFVFATIISSLLFLQACSGIQRRLYSDYSVKPLDTSSLDTQCVVDPKIGQSLNKQETQNCILHRNHQVIRWLINSDNLCEDHMKTIYGNEASYNIIFGTMTNIFAGLGVVFSDPVTKTAMAASALLSNSERSLVNESVYKTVIVSSIVKKIRDDREKRKAAIIANLKDPSLSYDKYPVNFAAADIQEYHYQCSFMYGLQKALEEGTQDTTPQKILQLKRELEEVEQKMKIRAMESGLNINKKLTKQEIESDYFLTQLQTRYEAINKELPLLQGSMTPSTPKVSPTGTSVSEPPKDAAGKSSEEDKSKEVGTQPTPKGPGN